MWQCWPMVSSLVVYGAVLGICRALAFLQRFCWRQSFYLCWLFPSECLLVSICACLHSVWWCLVSSAHRVVMVTFQACLRRPFSLTRHLSHTHILSMGLFLFLFYFTTLSCYNNNKEKITKIYKYDHPLNNWAIDVTFLFFNFILVIPQLPNYWVAIKL